MLRLHLVSAIALPAFLPSDAQAQAGDARPCIVVFEQATAHRSSGSAADVERAQGALEHARGAVKNARGCSPLEAKCCFIDSLNANAGAGTIESGRRVSWLVGRLTLAGRQLVFASAVWRASGAPDTLDATPLAIRTFVERDVPPPSR